MRSEVGASRLSTVLVWILGLVALRETAPGFRPKHLVWIAQGLSAGRGLSFLAYLGLILFLLPAANRLRKLKITKTVSAGLVALLLIFFLSEFLMGLLSGSATLEVMALRITVIGAGVWGWLAAPHFKWKIPKPSFRDPALKLLGVLLFFFLLREQLRQVADRAIPFVPFGDEIHTWFEMSKGFVNSGLVSTLHTHNYYPGIPWLIALSSRIFGVHNDEWLFGYPAFLAMAIMGWVWEVSRGTKSWVAGLAFLTFVFITSTDLSFYFTGTLYGEGTTSLLLSVLLAEIYLRWEDRKSPIQQSLAGMVLVLGFCGLSKPPMATLLPLFGLLAAGVISRGRGVSLRTGCAAAVILLESLPAWIWKQSLMHFGLKPEYSVKPAEIIAKGFSWDVLGNLFKRVATFRSISNVYGAALAIAFVICFLQRKKDLGNLMVGTCLIYFGFVFGLYCTLWQATEIGSMERYCSHSAIACLMLIPLAFTQTSRESL